jgi:hypothetical protein
MYTMLPFLDKVAGEIFTIHSLDRLKDTCVVLPSRRATHFFRRALAAQSDKPIISPHIFAIDDFICELSGLQIADPITLLFELFNCYSAVENEISFEKFIRWAPTVLKDFDLIDQYMVPDVRQLFAYIDEAEAISRWSPEAEKPIAVTDYTADYFSFNRTLANVYYRFNQVLQEKEIAYRGKAYRQVAESLFDFLKEEMPYEHFYFVGLNALSTSEKSIVTQLVKSKRATCFWDTDHYFMSGNHQAGDVLRNYRKEGIFGLWNEPENLLLTDNKEIHVLESPFETLQAKMASQLVSDKQTVFVVPDETMLQPILFSMGEQLPEYNISMGLGMAYSKLSVLWTAILDLHTLGSFPSAKGERFHFEYVIRILNDPKVQEYERVIYGVERPYKVFSDLVKRSNLVYVSLNYLTDYFPEDKLIRAIFNPWSGSSLRLIFCLKSLLNILQDSVLSSSDLLEKEFYLLLLSVANRLETEIVHHPDLSLEGVRSLMTELNKQERVPFRGDQVADLQIMSLLETRCLDFEHVVFFSFNEGVIPAAQKNSSMLPYDVCQQFGIPVYSDQDSIMAYHFYRLLMRAKKVTLIYSAASGGLGASKEPSRFILQLIHQLINENPKLRLTNKQIGFRNVGQNVNETEISVEKTPEVYSRIKTYLETKGLSASSLNTYINCELQFYLSKILSIDEQDEVQEVFGADVFGNWMHYTIERISKEIIGLRKELKKDNLPRVLTAIPRLLEEVFQKHFKGFEKETGLNLVYEKMAAVSLKSYYESYFFCGEPKQVLASEYTTVSYLPVYAEADTVNLKLTGNIDSVEKHGNELVLIDYKTGKVESSDLNISQKKTFEQTLAAAGKNKFRQIYMYKYLAYREIMENRGELGKLFSENTIVRAGMYSFQSKDKIVISAIDAVERAELLQKMENWFTILVSDMLDTAQPISQTKDVENCSYCHFIDLCGR